VEDDDEGRRRQVQLGLEERLRPRLLQVVEDEPAGSELADDAGSEHRGDGQDGQPHPDDPPPPPHAEPTETRKESARPEPEVS